MSFAHAMVLVAALLPYVTVALAKAGARGYDNAEPRVSEARLTGWRARANAAHANHFEAFAPFAAAVILAESGHAAPATIGWLAGAFILLRIAYVAAYLTNRATLRSTLWGLAFACVLALFGLGI